MKCFVVIIFQQLLTGGQTQPVLDGNRIFRPVNFQPDILRPCKRNTVPGSFRTGSHMEFRRACPRKGHIFGKRTVHGLRHKPQTPPLRQCRHRPGRGGRAENVRPLLRKHHRVDVQIPGFIRIQIVIHDIMGVQVRPQHRAAMPQADHIAFCTDNHRIERIVPKGAQRAVRNRRVDSVSFGQEMVAGVGQVVFPVLFDNKRPLRPAVQVSADQDFLAEFRRGVHFAAHNAPVVCPIGIPPAIVVDKDGEVDGAADVSGDFPERAGGAVAFQHIVAEAVGRRVHVKRAVPPHDLRRKGNQAGELLLRHRRPLRFPVHQILRAPAPDVRIRSVKIISSVIAQNKRVCKIAVLFDGVAVSIHRLTP